MCGFLLRTVFLSLILYLLLGIESAVHIVTLGGQILGAASVGLLTACYHTIGRRFFVNICRGRSFAVIISGLTMVFAVRVLPGYKVVNFTMFLCILITFCLIGWIVNYFIEDK